MCTAYFILRAVAMDEFSVYVFLLGFLFVFFNVWKENRVMPAHSGQQTLIGHKTSHGTH
jgi:hypothetical protein